MKTYVITLSKKFLGRHPRAGEETNFEQKFKTGQTCAKCKKIKRGMCLGECFPYTSAKLHTIRGNYELWEKRIKEVQDGNAILSVRQWTGKPYRSKQVEIACLTAADGVGLQKLYFLHPFDLQSTYVNSRVNAKEIAANDGLSLSDWLAWFSTSKPLEPMAVIHFTQFRY